MVFKVFYQALKFLQRMKAAPDQIRKKITVTSQHLLSRVVSYDDTKVISKRFHKAPLLSVLAFRRFDTRFSLDKILFQITPTSDVPTNISRFNLCNYFFYVHLKSKCELLQTTVLPQKLMRCLKFSKLVIITEQNETRSNCYNPIKLQIQQP